MLLQSPVKPNTTLLIKIIKTVTTFLIVSIIGLFLYNGVYQRKSALLIESNPVAKVYIDGNEKGMTPLELVINKEEVVLHLVAKGLPLPPWGAKIKLTEGVKTIVRRKFGESEGLDSSQIISYRKNSSGNAGIYVVSIPDEADLYLGDRLLGASPLRVDIFEGKHVLREIHLEVSSLFPALLMSWKISALKEV